MRERETYELIRYQEGKWWMVFSPEIIQVTQAEQFEETEVMGRDLIATILNVEPDSFDVRFVDWDGQPDNAEDV